MKQNTKIKQKMFHIFYILCYNEYVKQKHIKNPKMFHINKGDIMKEKGEIITILQTRQTLLHELSTLTYGSVEIRESGSNKYLYVHYREDGRLLTKYVGEYSDELYNLILKNNIRAREIKKNINKITKSLKKLTQTYKE